MLRLNDEMTDSSYSKEHINEVTHRCPKQQQGNVSISFINYVYVHACSYTCVCLSLHICLYVCVYACVLCIRVRMYMYVCYNILTGGTSNMSTVSGCSSAERRRVS